MKKLFGVLIIIVCLALINTIIGCSSTPIEIGSVNLQDVRNGSYTGEYQSGPVKAVVLVEVEDHRIVKVKIEKHDCGLGKKAEKITVDIEKTQSLNVDAVSGATLSSKVILKAVEIALQKGVEKK